MAGDIFISRFLKYNEDLMDRIIAKSTGKLFPDPENDYPFFMMENLLSADQCDAMVKNFLISGPAGKAKIYLKGANLVNDTRDTFLLKMEEEEKLFIKNSVMGLVPEIEQFFKVKVKYNEGFHALGYSPGCRFAFHSDNGNFYPERETGENKWQVDIPHRTLSSVLFLTDSVERITDFNQCTGGELVFGFLLDKDNNAFAIKPRKGLFIVFPSNSYYAHEVEPVNEGYRVSIVDWYNCEIL
jgi:SM-20-related protein